MPSSCYTDAVCDVDTLAARRYVEGRGDTVVHLRRVPAFRMGPSIKRKFAPGECPYSWPVTSHINLPSAALCDARSLKTTERMLQQWHVQIIDSVTMRQHCFSGCQGHFGRADKAFEAHRCCPGSVSHHGCQASDMFAKCRNECFRKPFVPIITCPRKLPRGRRGTCQQFSRKGARHEKALACRSIG